MKLSPHLIVPLLTTAALLPATDSATGPQIYVNVVGEVFAPTGHYSAPSATAPAHYVLHDAGYIEAGDPMGNDEPPPASVVTQALARYLPASHFLPATAAQSPSLLLVSHWGVLRESSTEIAPNFEIRKNLRARIRLVATPESARRIESELTDRIYRHSFRAGIPMPELLDFDDRTTLDIAKDNHYFVIVTAYDYAAALNKQITPVWRLKISTYDQGTDMVGALPALIRNGSQYFGQNTPKAINGKMPLLPPASVNLPEPTFLGEAAGPTARVNGELLAVIAKKESSELLGTKASQPALAEK